MRQFEITAVIENWKQQDERKLGLNDGFKFVQSNLLDKFPFHETSW